MGGVPETVHATAIALGDRAALIRGPSGSGKSDLALRCLGLAPSNLLPKPFKLVSDDRVVLAVRSGSLYAAPPPTIEGLIEVRGVGLIKVPFDTDARVSLIVDLVAPDAVPRLPDSRLTTSVKGIEVPAHTLAAFENSAPLKLALMLQSAS